MHSNRIFIVEPNLIKQTGHPMEYASAILRNCRKTGIEAHCIANRRVHTEIQERLGNVLAGITNGCFDRLEDQGCTFLRDLEALNSTFRFTDSDLVLVPTSYVNEMVGINRYLRGHLGRQCPRFALWFHQLFPPTTVFTDSLRASYQKIWTSRLADAFEGTFGQNKLSLWTTPSTLLNEAYSKLAARRVGILPNPCDYEPEYPEFKTANMCETKVLKYAFLGDGRYEKGLLLVLLSILESQDRSNSYIIQDIDTRGYSSAEFSMLQKAKGQLSSWRNIQFLNHPLEGRQFYRLIHSVDVLLLPYHPLSYDRRVSSIFIQAAQCAKPVVVTSGSWLSEEVRRFSAGKKFTYGRTIQETVLRLTRARLRVEDQIEKYRLASKGAANFYIDRYSTRSFMGELLSSIGQ